MSKKNIKSADGKKSFFSKLLNVSVAKDYLMILVVVFLVLFIALWLKPSIYNIPFFSDLIFIAKIQGFLSLYLIEVILSLIVGLIGYVVFSKYVFKKVEFVSFWSTLIMLVLWVSFFFVFSYGFDAWGNFINESGAIIPDDGFDDLKPGEFIQDDSVKTDFYLDRKIYMNGAGDNSFYLSTTSAEFCGKDIHYIFTPTCNGKPFYDSLVEEISPLIDTEIVSYCSGSDNEEACVSAGYKYPENPETFKEVFFKEGAMSPVLVIGCNTQIAGAPTKEDVLRIICEKIGDCVNEENI